MRRGVFDTIRRGLDNTFANWPILLLRLAETILFFVVGVIAVIAILIPILVSVGIRIADLTTPDDVAGAALLLGQKWLLLIWIFLGISGLFLVFVAIHSFVQAGSARIYVDGERIAGPALEGNRTRYGVFSMQRWFAGAVDGWWTLFWVYNLAWGAASIILLVPLLPTLLLMLVLREEGAAVVAIGCLGILLTMMLLLVVSVITGMWTNRAIAGWAVRRAGARDALAAGWRALREDFGRHLLIALAMIVVSLAGSTFFASFSLLASLGESVGDSTVFALVTLPMRLIVSIFSSAFSAVVSSWYLASYSALAMEARG